MNKQTTQQYGYARVSSKNQKLARQISALMQAGIEKQNLFIDKQSGKDFNRPGYQRLIRKIQARDELYIKSIDRLGRNYDEILEQWRYLTKVKQADVIVLDFPLLDTRRSTGGVTGAFISDLVLQILSYVAQIERENTHQRQLEGIREAKKRGVQFGRPKIPIPERFDEVAEKIRNNKMSLRQGGRILGVSYTTLRNWMKAQKSADS
ncbi:recombinase family protein [Pseudoramibacter porci]|uniref:recombinase family protein n=1 Tax=Pseudoramibacter porci TaxID=2606631 RepID=UPI00197CDBE8|nr:recombinase family protein [Pseudoramibacter porci]